MMGQIEIILVFRCNQNHKYREDMSFSHNETLFIGQLLHFFPPYKNNICL